LAKVLEKELEMGKAKDLETGMEWGLGWVKDLAKDLYQN
jgi:hypothetical protein